VPRPIAVDHPLVLGSGSPRRREILDAQRIPIVVRPSSADEATRAGEAAGAYLERVVEAELAAVRARADVRGDAWILVADTSVVIDGRILGKPDGEGDARSMLVLLAGRTHEVMTRFAVAGEGALHAETVATRVTFRPLDDGEIDVYAASGEGIDKAGGYAVQGLGASLVARIDGSYSSVVGLPACEVIVALRRLGALPR